jgi:hypothetical protein
VTLNCKIGRNATRRPLVAPLYEVTSVQYIKRFGDLSLIIDYFLRLEPIGITVLIVPAYNKPTGTPAPFATFPDPCPDTVALYLTGRRDDFMAPLIDWLQERNMDSEKTVVLERAALLYCQ